MFKSSWKFDEWAYIHLFRAGKAYKRFDIFLIWVIHPRFLIGFIEFRVNLRSFITANKHFITENDN